MDDMERYGDYNELDEAPRGKRGPVSILLRVLIGLVCFLVIGVIVFRLFLFNFYPREMRQIYFTDSLTAFYEERGGEVNFETQELRFPYDDERDGNFFCDNLILVREAGQLQLSVRFNKSFLEELRTALGHEINPDTDLIFTLARTADGYEDEEGATDVPTVSAGSLAATSSEKLLMYRYYKLCFDGVDFGLDGDTPVSWLRLEIRIRGYEDKAPYCVLVYENHEGFARFDEYKPARREVPQ